MELHPNGEFTKSEQMYVDAYRLRYEELVREWEENKEDLFASEPTNARKEQWREEARDERRAELIKAFEEKKLVPSTVEQKLNENKEELYGYKEYYKDKWRKEHDKQNGYKDQNVEEMDGVHMPMPAPVEEDLPPASTQSGTGAQTELAQDQTGVTLSEASTVVQKGSELSPKVLKKTSAVLGLLNATADALAVQKPLFLEGNRSYVGVLPRMAGLWAVGGGVFGSSYYALNIAKSGLNDKNAAGLVGNALFFREGSLILMSLTGRSGHDIHHAHIHIGKVGASADALKAYSALREGNSADALTYGLLGYGNLRASLENKDLVHSYRIVLKFMARKQTARANIRMAISATHFLYKHLLGVKHPIILLSGAAFGAAGKLWPSSKAAEASGISQPLTLTVRDIMHLL